MLGKWGQKISIKQLIWLFPLVFLIHDGEEILTYSSWMREHRDELHALVGDSVVSPLFLAATNTTTRQFTVAVAVIFLFLPVLFLALYIGRVIA
ncbi:MAG: HXXEE domain-containing protein [Brevibacillus sp.]|nr:HXXEE domain-containing protein [Brevibacillus sp.]